MVAEIKVIGNKEYFQLTRTIQYLEIRLAGDFAFTANTPVDFFYGHTHFQFNNRQDLFQFSEDCRGASFNKLILLLLSKGININMGANNKPIESSLLKSIFLIYNWIELPLTAPEDLNLKEKLSDEFVVDWTNQPEPQKDIYFIDEKRCISDNQSSINKLIDLNLLARLEITVNNKLLVSYFIPLYKPGVSRELFITASDTRGNTTYNLWQQILNERNIRISKWVNNRF